MATKKDLEKKLKELRESLDAVPAEFKDEIQAEIEATEKELAGKGKKTEEVKEEVEVPESSDPFIQSMLGTIAAAMKTGSGGVDSPQVRAIIEDYLRDDKVKLSELDESVLEEIKRNQTILIEIPSFAQKIEVSAAVAKIPHIFDIIDDILAGNNVFLLGEAGGGKTYTAETVADLLKRPYVTLNCSQYTSPLEILGGQSIEGFKEGKLIDCWRNGKILILDEMPKLDANTAGLLNDALAKSTKTKPAEKSKINSANTEEPPIERNDDFGIIATGNIYPNEPPPPQYSGNNQQDLSLLDRFSGSVYFTQFDEYVDQTMTRFKFLYDFLVGNFYEYIDAQKNNRTTPKPVGLRTVIYDMQLKNLALVSYRTDISFRVGFEFELVRAIAEKEGKNVQKQGKTLLKTFKSYMTAFMSSRDTYNTLIENTGYTDEYVQNMADKAIKEILDGKDGFLNSLNPEVRSSASGVYERYEDFYVPQSTIIE